MRSFIDYTEVERGMTYEKVRQNNSLHGVCAGTVHHLGLYPKSIRRLFIVTFPISLFLHILLANTMDVDRASS